MTTKCAGATVVVLGPSSRLASAIIPALRAADFAILPAGRAASPAGCVDVTDPACWDPSAWTQTAARYRITGALSLIAAARSADADSAIAVAIGAARTMTAVRDAARAHGGDPVMIHIGSAAEAQAGDLSAYAQGKVAGRAEARRLGSSVILTLGVVPRPPGDPADRWLRRACWLAPQLAGVAVAVSLPGQVGAAIEYLITKGAGDQAGLAEVVLAAEIRNLGAVVGAATGIGIFGGAVTTALAGMPEPRAVNLRRLRGLARMARRPGAAASGHYLAAAPGPGEHLAASSSGGFRLAPRDRPDSLGDRWLVPPGSSTGGSDA